MLAEELRHVDSDVIGVTFETRVQGQDAVEQTVAVVTQRTDEIQTAIHNEERRFGGGRLNEKKPTGKYYNIGNFY